LERDSNDKKFENKCYEENKIKNCRDWEIISDTMVRKVLFFGFFFLAALGVELNT
jgi:hypothetical protein